MKKILNYLAIVLTIVLHVQFTVSYVLPDAQFEILKPKGFQVSIPDEPGLKLFEFHANVNRRIQENEPGELSGNVYRAKNGRWTYKNTRRALQDNDVINYWIYAEADETQHRRTGLSFTVKSSESQRIDRSTTSQGRLIFEENFDSIDSSRWLREIKMPLSPDYEFSVLHNDNHPGLVEVDGTLRIKPLILEDSYGQNATTFGKFTLAGCTSIIPEECSRTAITYSILPPVISARLTTRNSFGFKYGKIEIRAKFPAGDWLYPELWLEPRYSIYGPGYNSGRVLLGLSRGNENLVSNTDTAKIWDSRKLEFGVRIGPSENVREHLISRLQQNGPRWTEDFHVYTTIWNENGFTFFVDDEELGQINAGPEGWMPDNTTMRTQKNTPFDQEFSITVGLGVGGLRVFPDETFSSGYAKPWKNVGAKAMLKFWNARNLWLPSWRRNDSKNIKLEVDYIKVWSLN